MTGDDKVAKWSEWSFFSKGVLVDWEGDEQQAWYLLRNDNFFVKTTLECQGSVEMPERNRVMGMSSW